MNGFLHAHTHCTIIPYLNHIELSKWKVWNKLLTTLSISMACDPVLYTKLRSLTNF